METKVESLRSNDKGWNGGALEFSPLRKVRMKSVFLSTYNRACFQSLAEISEKKSYICRIIEQTIFDTKTTFSYCFDTSSAMPI